MHTNKQKTLLVRQKVVKLKDKPVKKSKTKVTGEQLKAVIYAVFQEADVDGNGSLDIAECRAFCKKLQAWTYPDMVWDDEKYKQGFYAIDVDKGGTIDFDEMYEIIYKNAQRQGMIVGAQ